MNYTMYGEKEKMTIPGTSLKDAKIDPSQPFRCLVHGAPGTRKTTLFGSWPKPMVVFDFDQKLKPLYNLPDKENIHVLTYSPADVGKSSQEYLRFIKDWNEAKKNPEIKTMVIDGITMLDILVVRHFVIMSGKEPSTKPTIAIYGEQAETYNYFFKYMVNDISDKWVFVTAHSDIIIDEKLGVVEQRPIITGKKFPPKLPAMFEEVWFTELEEFGGETVGVLYYKKHRRAIATSTTMQGEGKIINPSFDKIMEEIKKGRK